MPGLEAPERGVRVPSALLVGSHRGFDDDAGRDRGLASLRVADRAYSSNTGLRVAADEEITLVAGAAPSEVLVLQGRPIGEPVVHYGPFVMNSAKEIEQAIVDCRRGAFGDWPWPSVDPVHDRERGRFAVHADCRLEEA